MKTIKIAIGLPWYSGPDHETTAEHFYLMNYFGRLKERSYIIAQWVEEGTHPLLIEERLSRLPELKADLPRSMWGTKLDFVLIEEVKCSLPGMARERICDRALLVGADYIFMWDADMCVPETALLTLLQDEKPIVAALAFCGREPVKPVLYSFLSETRDNGDLGLNVQVIENYIPDALQEVDAVGFGCVLINMDVFKKIPKSWFNVAGMGEDVFFCLRAVKHGIPVHADTRVKVPHKPTFHKTWHTEEYYQSLKPKTEPFWQDTMAVPA